MLAEFVCGGILSPICRAMMVHNHVMFSKRIDWKDSYSNVKKFDENMC